MDTTFFRVLDQTVKTTQELADYCDALVDTMEDLRGSLEAYSEFLQELIDDNVEGVKSEKA